MVLFCEDSGRLPPPPPTPHSPPRRPDTFLSFSGFLSFPSFSGFLFLPNSSPFCIGGISAVHTGVCFSYFPPPALLSSHSPCGGAGVLIRPDTQFKRSYSRASPPIFLSAFLHIFISVQYFVEFPQPVSVPRPNLTPGIIFPQCICSFSQSPWRPPSLPVPAPAQQTEISGRLPSQISQLGCSMLMSLTG